MKNNGYAIFINTYGDWGMGEDGCAGKWMRPADLGTMSAISDDTLMADAVKCVIDAYEDFDFDVTFMHDLDKATLRFTNCGEPEMEILIDRERII